MDKNIIDFNIKRAAKKVEWFTENILKSARTMSPQEKEAYYLTLAADTDTDEFEETVHDGKDWFIDLEHGRLINSDDIDEIFMGDEDE